jgi:hypothetical protein
LWFGVDRYLGLKFVIKGTTRYGWARLTVSMEFYKVSATLKGYAYETIPGKAIIAGATKGPDDGEPAASLNNAHARTRHTPRTGNGSTWTANLAAERVVGFDVVSMVCKEVVHETGFRGEAKSWTEGLCIEEFSC